MSLIAFRRGFFWQTLWDLPGNKALHALQVGDRILEGTTNDAGHLEEWVSPSTTRVVLTVWLDRPARSRGHDARPRSATRRRARHCRSPGPSMTRRARAAPRIMSLYFEPPDTLHKELTRTKSCEPDLSLAPTIVLSHWDGDHHSTAYYIVDHTTTNKVVNDHTRAVIERAHKDQSGEFDPNLDGLPCAWNGWTGPKTSSSRSRCLATRRTTSSLR